MFRAASFDVLGAASACETTGFELISEVSRWRRGSVRAEAHAEGIAAGSCRSEFCMDQQQVPFGSDRSHASSGSSISQKTFTEQLGEKLVFREEMLAL
ncbi:unnamed protein product [Heligmosomoides polygyrus]|uniref:Uncharacterized protein n=1 Tax=Heligmosomoides polygyrus TaxID=6339 RepID=A0A183FJ76_HELPZ|nr:unnamed protein product [Heligmosomoides polygyrus]